MIITSLLDTDLYKFTMMQVVLHQFPGAQVEYRFKCRNPGVQLAPYVNEIRDEIRSLCSLRFQDAELAYLRSLRFIKSDFVDFLGLFQLNEKYITVTPQPTARSTSPSAALAAHHPVRDPGAGHRQRGVFPQHPARARLSGRPRRLDAKIELLQAPAWSAQDCRLRHAPALFARLA
jgi:nicotinate phosphoribosyltransferase